MYFGHEVVNYIIMKYFKAQGVETENLDRKVLCTQHGIYNNSL